MIRPIGPLEIEMEEKYPATRWLHEPHPHFVAGPQAAIDAAEAHRKKAIEFIKSPEGERLAQRAVEASKAFEEAKLALMEACDDYCAKERAHVADTWKGIREKTIEYGPQVEPPTRKFHDRNWVDEKYGWEERVAEPLTDAEKREARDD